MEEKKETKGKIYLVCPECRRVEEATESYWYEMVNEWRTYLHVRDEDGTPKRGLMSVVNSEHLLTGHYPCDFLTTEWRAEDFEVVIENGKITRAGGYWEKNVKTLEEILKRAGILEDKRKTQRRNLSPPRP